MLKLAHHPKAFLTHKKNVQPGLSTRTRIISVLEKKASTIKRLSREAGLSYSTVLYHIHLLEAENILNSRSRKPSVWELTGVGQQRLIQRERS
jgi:predicted ArsR family transcriptional regulator